LSNNERAAKAYQRFFGPTVTKNVPLKYEEKNGEGYFTVCPQNESNTDVRYLTSAMTQQEYYTNTYQ